MIADAIARDGFALIARLADDETIAHLKAIFAEAGFARSERRGETYGARNLLAIAAVRDVVRLPSLRSVLHETLGEHALAVRGLFFDKTAGANWPVPWHQDLTLALREHRDLPGWSNWTLKRGVQHAQPPAEILSRMLTLRLHLDDCGSGNGPLRVIAGSHAQGVLGRDAIKARIDARPHITVTAKAGDALLMRPLILHASSSARAPSHRRVLHLEFAPVGLLPAGADWAQAA